MDKYKNYLNFNSIINKISFNYRQNDLKIKKNLLIASDLKTLLFTSSSFVCGPSNDMVSVVTTANQRTRL